MTTHANETDPVIAEMIAAGLIPNPIEALATDEVDEIADDEIADEPVLEVGAGLINEPAPIAEFNATTDASIEAELAELELSEASDVPLATAEIDLAVLEASLEAEAARSEVYAEQVSTTTIVEGSAAPATAGAAVIKKVASATPGTGPKREARFAPGAAGAYVSGVLASTALEAAVDALPKKVKEKAANLVDFICKGRTLSVFTQVAVDIMNAESKLTNERLVRAFTTEASKRGMGGGYSIGTARSQAGQQIALFSRLGLANVAGGVLVPNNASELWVKLAKPAA